MKNIFVLGTSRDTVGGPKSSSLPAPPCCDGEERRETKQGVGRTRVCPVVDVKCG